MHRGSALTSFRMGAIDVDQIIRAGEDLDDFGSSISFCIPVRAYAEVAGHRVDDADEFRRPSQGKNSAAARSSSLTSVG